MSVSRLCYTRHPPASLEDFNNTNEFQEEFQGFGASSGCCIETIIFITPLSLKKSLSYPMVKVLKGLNVREAIKQIRALSFFRHRPKVSYRQMTFR